MTQIIADILYFGLLTFILALSFQLIFTVTRIFHIAHALAFIFPPYFLFLLYIQGSIPIFLSIITSVAFCIIIMLTINSLVYRNLRKRDAKTWQFLVASLGIYIVLQNIISLSFGDTKLSFRTWELSEGILILGAYLSPIQIISIASCIFVFVITWFIIEKTNIGIKIKAVSSNPELSEIFGISSDKIICYCFILGSGLASIVGILLTADIDMTPTMGFNWILYAIVAMIIGGMGKFRFLLMGSFLLVTAQQLAAYFIDSKWMDAVVYMILILFLIWRPLGFSGKQLKKIEI